MNAKEFFNLVSQMRTTQKDYFRTRSKYALDKSKDLEKRVDAEIERVKELLYERENPKIF